LRPMLDDRIIRAARNNAEWCDAVCRAHENPGEFHDDVWLNRNAVPRFYPNAGTLAGASPRQLALIDELIAARLPSGWAVKDSFSMLAGSGSCSTRSGSTYRLRESRTSPRREPRRDGKSSAVISHWLNGNPRGACRPAIRAKIEFSCRRYSTTKMSQWSPDSVMAISSQVQSRIAAMTSLDGRTSSRPRPTCSILPGRRSQRSAWISQACPSLDTNMEVISATRMRWASNR
jgi:hypothetical protein